MTQGRDGNSLAHAQALKLMAIAGRLSLVAAMFAVAALLAGTAGTSYAQPPQLEDSVVVSNYGGAYFGSLESFCGENPLTQWLPVVCPEGATHNSKPALLAAGPSTLLGVSTGAGLDAVSSLDDHVAVAVPIDLTDQTCFGEPVVFAPNKNEGGYTAAPFTYPESCNVYIRNLLGLPANAPVPAAPFLGTGFAAIFTPGANGDVAPETIIGTRDASFSVSGDPDVYTFLPPTTGVNTPQGVAFESPFDGNPLVPTGHEIVAVANTLPYVIGNEFGPQPGEPACAALGGATVGSITMFDSQTLQSGYNDNAVPFQSSLVLALNKPYTIVNHKVAASPFPDTLICSTVEPSDSYKCYGFPYLQNVTIGGCSTFLLAPVGLTFDGYGQLFVVNNAVLAAPGFVDVFPAFTYGDELPTAIIGLITTPDLANPAAVAVATEGFDGSADLMYVSDKGFTVGSIYTDLAGNVVKITPAMAVPPSIHIIAPFDPPTCFTAFYPLGCTGTEFGAIQGKSTKLKGPVGVALSQDGDTLYVVNQLGNSLEMFTGVDTIVGTQDLPPTLVIAGPKSGLNMPTGVALPQFTD